MATTQMRATSTATPAAGQVVEHEGKTYETVKEGLAYILIPPNTQKHVNPQAKVKADDPSLKPQNVFYNPIQQFNRDLSVLSIKAFGEDWIEKRKARNSKNKEKVDKKRSRKRKRSEFAHAKDNEEDEEEPAGGVKVQKALDERATAEEHTATGGQDAAQQSTEDVDANGLHAAVVKTDITTEDPRETAMDIESNGPSAALMEREAISDDRGKTATNVDSNEQRAKAEGPRFRILDALSATGLRALRYAKEIPFATSIVANDMSSNAVASIKHNILHNDLSSKIESSTADAIGHMYSVAYPSMDSHGPRHVNRKYDVIDLDPYGTAAVFIDAALQALNDGGLLCVTCTDSGVFASTGYCEKTYSLYGGMPVKGPYMHEAGLRLIINSIATSAAKYGIAIEPLLSLKIDFYARTFIRVRKSPAEVKFLAGKTMLVYCCDSGCGAWATQTLGRNTKQTGKNGNEWYKHSIAQAPSADRTCEHCGNKTHIAGPMWGGPIHNPAFIEKVLDLAEAADEETYQTKTRIEGMLTTALEELQVVPEVLPPAPSNGANNNHPDMIPNAAPEVVDRHPFYFSPSALSKVIHCQAPGDAMIKGALRRAGYRATRSHCQAGSIKTDASWSVLWEIMREWVRQKSPIKEGGLKESTAGYRIMQAARDPEETLEDTEPSDGVTETQNGMDQGKQTRPKRVKVVFDEALGRDKPGKRLVRYQVNPRENWGPMTRAKGSA